MFSLCKLWGGVRSRRRIGQVSPLPRQSAHFDRGFIVSQGRLPSFRFDLRYINGDGLSSSIAAKLSLDVSLLCL